MNDYSLDEKRKELRKLSKHVLVEYCVEVIARNDDIYKAWQKERQRTSKEIHDCLMAERAEAPKRAKRLRRTKTKRAEVVTHRPKLQLQTWEL